MRIFDIFGMCLRNLYKRKLRTFLTLLGVMIGTGSIILMISLGLATDAQFAQMIDDMDMDMTAISVWQRWGGWSVDAAGNVMEHEQGGPLTDEVADRIAQLPGVEVATPIMNMDVIVRTGPYAARFWVRGLRPEALALMGYVAEYGRLLEAEDEFAAVFSSRAEREFFSTIMTGGWENFRPWSERYWDERMGMEVETLVDIHNDPLRIYYDTQMRIGMGNEDFGGIDLEEAFQITRSFPLEIVGVLEHYDGGMWGGRNNNTVFMNIETLQLLNQFAYQTRRQTQEENEFRPQMNMIREGPRMEYQEIFVRAASMDYTASIAEYINEMGFNASYQGGWIDTMRDMSRGTETLLAAIAAISLIIAAINIANTMITSVTERTREIGVMKVIGASISDVRRLFLLESVVIGLMGGLFGVGLALLASFAMNNFDIEFLNNLNMGAPGWAMGETDTNISLITPWLCGLALLVAGGVGLISGYYPAWRATRLSALAAIRGD
jgi:ABC-type antimicrobial peptide transport system permease subunit